jgi:hypothetical protein
MKYTQTTPCAECPFRKSMAHGFSMSRLKEFARGEFPCHKSADTSDDAFVATDDSVHCAGALIFLEKRESPHQMMRIAERLGMYDRKKLNMNSRVR